MNDSSKKQDVISKKVVDGVEIIEFTDGHTEFRPVKEDIKIETNDERNWFRKLVDWFKESKITPYIKIRDLEDPFDDNTKDIYDRKGMNSPEIGIRIKF